MLETLVFIYFEREIKKIDDLLAYVITHIDINNILVQ